MITGSVHKTYGATSVKVRVSAASTQRVVKIAGDNARVLFSREPESLLTSCAAGDGECGDVGVPVPLQSVTTPA